MSNPLWSFINPKAEKTKKLKFSALTSTGFLNLDYLHEEMLDSFEQGHFFAAITMANTLCELAVRYFLVFSETLTQKASFSVNVKRYNMLSLDKCIDALAKHGVRNGTIANLHTFEKTLQNYLAEGSIATMDPIASNKKSGILSADKIDYNGLVHYGFVAPLALLRKSETYALFSIFFATNLLEKDIPFQHMLSVSEIPDFTINKEIYFSKAKKPEKLGKERKVRVSVTAFDHFEKLWKKLPN